MYWKSFVVAFLAIIFLAAPASAETVIGCEYDAVNELCAWDLGFEYQITEWLDFGATFKCYLDPKEPYNFKAGLIPAGVPYLQRYEIWAEAAWGDFSFIVSSWCNHYLAQSRVPAYYDTHGLTVRMEFRL